MRRRAYRLIGTPAFVMAFFKDKTSAMVDDVEKLRVLSDPLTHDRLIEFCHNTRLSHLNRNLPQDVMRSPTRGLGSTRPCLWR